MLDGIAHSRYNRIVVMDADLSHPPERVPDLLAVIELIVRGRLRVREVPIAFADRRRAKSKLRWRQQLDYLRHLGRLYAHVLARVVRRPALRR